MKIVKNLPFAIDSDSTLFVTSPALPDYMEIKNADGKIFYLRYKTPEKNTIKININKPGTYIANFDAEAQIKPIEIINPIKVLPEKERGLKTTINIVPTILEKTPARIYSTLGIIEYDKQKFSSYPIPFKVFILLHEIGHFFYKTEWKADLFALYHFIQLGYNPSNAFYTLSYILDGNSEQGAERINNLFNAIQQHG